MTHGPSIDHAARDVSRLNPWRRRFLLQLLIFLLVVLPAAEACADVIGLMIYRVRVFDGAKWHEKKLPPGTHPQFSYSEWKFLHGPDWPPFVKVEVFWRWTGEQVCNGCYAEARSNGAPVGEAASKTIDNQVGKIFVYENRPSNSTLIPSLKIYAKPAIVSSESKVTLKAVADFKFPWVTIVSPAEGQTFKAGPIPLLVEVKSNIPKKPSTVRLEVHKKVGGKWTWAAPGAIDLPWTSFPYTLPAPALAGEYRMRVQGKKGSTIGVYSPWRTYKVQ